MENNQKKTGDNRRPGTPIMAYSRYGRRIQHRTSSSENLAGLAAVHERNRIFSGGVCLVCSIMLVLLCALGLIMSAKGCF